MKNLLVDENWIFKKMYKKDFRYSLMEILNEAGVPQTLSREKFINLSWHKYNNENKNAPLFHDYIEKDACRFVIGILKKSNMYSKYRLFMGDVLFKVLPIKKE